MGEEDTEVWSLLSTLENIGNRQNWNELFLSIENLNDYELIDTNG